ncbi:MAG TPA: sterol desaturase family protein [Candidatus Kapabacteria bacterium]|nr:sterol desaturase family protein [Candidatus Kapabacteria bacterium]
MARRYVSNKNETVRMFESNFMEFFSHVHPSTPLVVYLPVMGYMFYRAFAIDHLEAASVAGLFVGGVLSWSFIEYILHRFVFHYQPKSEWGKRFHFILHGVHHDYPNDATRLVMPPGISIPLAIIFYVVFLLILGPHLTPPAFAGMVFGYLCYDMLHYATHHFSMKRGIWLKLKQYHMRHHYGEENTGYGVSSPLWDYVFGTIQERPKQK